MSENDAREKREILMRVAVSRVNVFEEMESLSASAQKVISWTPRIPGLSAETSRLALGAVAAGGLFGWWRRCRRKKAERMASRSRAESHGSVGRGLIAELTLGLALPIARELLMKRFLSGK